MYMSKDVFAFGDWREILLREHLSAVAIVLPEMRNDELKYRPVQRQHRFGGLDYVLRNRHLRVIGFDEKQNPAASEHRYGKPIPLPPVQLFVPHEIAEKRVTQAGGLGHVSSSSAAPARARR